MKLEETVLDMISDDYVLRFKAEYNQLCIRLEKLTRIIEKATANEVTFDKEESLKLLEAQAETMKNYKKILETRADNEGVRL